MEQLLTQLAEAVTLRQTARALRLQALLRIDLVAAIAGGTEPEGFRRIAWIATVDPRSTAIRRALAA